MSDIDGLTKWPHYGGYVREKKNPHLKLAMNTTVFSPNETDTNFR